MIRKIVIAIVVLVAAFFGFAALQPDTFHVVRSAIINAPSTIVFEQVNNQRKWEAWSPWAKLDPNAVTSYEGPEAGVGAVFRWSGNMEMGEGSSTIIESRPGALVRFQLDFTKPLAGTSTAVFTFMPEGDNTRVTWTMDGEKSLMAKALGLVLDCEQMMGKQFDEGLAALQTVAKEAAAPAAKTAPVSP